jgi:hypothetical protein
MRICPQQICCNTASEKHAGDKYRIDISEKHAGDNMSSIDIDNRHSMPNLSFSHPVCVCVREVCVCEPLAKEEWSL